MRRFVFRSPRLGFLAVGPALARPAAAFYRRNRAAFAPFDPVQPEDFFTEEGQAERLAEANVMPRNAASLRAAEKAGYRPEGLARRYLNINGVWEDHIHMVKLNEEEYHA